MAHLAKNTVSFGKHRGKTFADMLKSERSYCQWVVNQDTPGPALLPLIEYCQAMGVQSRAPGRPSTGSAASSALSQDNPPLSQSFSKGFSLPPSQPSPSAAPVSSQANFSEHLCEICSTAELQDWQIRCSSCFRTHKEVLSEDFYLRVPFDDKEEAKARGRVCWDVGDKKWYVPIGGDVSMFQKWWVKCQKCGEKINNKGRGKADKDECVGGECGPQRRAREAREAAEREEKEQKNNQEAFFQRKKEEFWKFLESEAQIMQSAMESKNLEANENMENQNVDRGSANAAKRRRKSTVSSAGAGKRGPIIGLEPFPGLKSGELLAFMRSKKGMKTYNPFAQNNDDTISSVAEDWICSFNEVSRSVTDQREKERIANAVSLQHDLEYTPRRILEFGCFVHASETVSRKWLCIRSFYLSLQKFLHVTLQQALDAITPDLARSIQNLLRSSYSTHCPDIEGVFGQNILPRCTAAHGAKWITDYTREQKADLAVLEYMAHRKDYDATCGETEATTRMRDIMTQTLETLTSSGKLIFEESSGGAMSSDRIYYKNGGGAKAVLIAHPNTRAVDLFDFGNSSAYSVRRKRVFGAFRRLHWRIARAVGNSYAVYGKDHGLRDADGDGRFLAFKTEHPDLHQELMALATLATAVAPITLREWVGFDSQRKHSNTDLVNLVFADWLGVESKAVTQAGKAAEKMVDWAAKELKKLQSEVKHQLRVGGVQVLDLD